MVRLAYVTRYDTINDNGIVFAVIIQEQCATPFA